MQGTVRVGTGPISPWISARKDHVLSLEMGDIVGLDTSMTKSQTINSDQIATPVHMSPVCRTLDPWDTQSARNDLPEHECGCNTDRRREDDRGRRLFPAAKAGTWTRSPPTTVWFRIRLLGIRLV